jgi:hypothetical protein
MLLAAASPAAAQQPTVTPAESLHLTLVAPAEARAGERVPFTLRLENRGTRPLDLYLRGRSLTFDVEVANPAGTVVWRRLEGEVIPAIVHLRTLAAGERLEVATAWDQTFNDGRPVPPGRYTVRALLLTEGTARVTPAAPLHLTPRGR